MRLEELFIQMLSTSLEKETKNDSLLFTFLVSDFDSNNSVIHFLPENFKRRMKMKFNQSEEDEMSAGQNVCSSNCSRQCRLDLNRGSLKTTASHV